LRVLKTSRQHVAKGEKDISEFSLFCNAVQ
jgi:hypothetical protein